MDGSCSSSDAGDLVADGTNFGDDNVFVRDVTGDTTTLVSVDQTGTADSNGGFNLGGISADGRFVVFMSDANNGVSDVFVRDLLSHTTVLVSAKANGAGTDSGTGFSFGGVLSADGGTIVFVSSAADLVPADNNGARDVFAAHLQVESTVVLTGAPQRPSISINDVTVAEGDSGTVNVTFTVSLSAASSQPVTVCFATALGTATAPADYVAIPTTTLTFNSGETSKLITVAVKGDTLDENDETFVVQLSNPNGALLADAQGLGTILDDDIAGSYLGSNSRPVNIVIDNILPGPTVALLERYGYHAQPTTLVLTFSKPLDFASAQNLDNYRIVPLGRWRKHHGRPIAVRAAVYVPVAQTVTLWPVARLNVHRSYQLTVNGTTSGGLTDAADTRLGAVGQTKPGVNYVAVIKWRTLAGSEFARRSRFHTWGQRFRMPAHWL